MSQRRILDISPKISPRTAVWPGDRAFSQTFLSKLADGSNIDLSSINTTVHIGAHADAPSHFVKGAPSIDGVSLEPYLGPCQVIEVQLKRSARIMPADVKDEIRAPRVLFKTGSFPDPEKFNEDFNSLSPELIEHLSSKKCVLVGLDTPSIDPFDSKKLESHQALGRLGLRNLEGLVLAHVKPGLYELAALPLYIEGSDASPVRAVLIG
ncbi:MAG: cyclase family protein [Bdellovibrionia bacterium]